MVTANTKSTKKPDLRAGEDRYELVKLAGEYILESGKHVDAKSALSTKELFEKAKDEFPDIFDGFIRETTFGVYLSKSGSDTESRINTLGRKQGYYLTRNVAAELLEESGDDIQTAKIKQHEKLLYPVVNKWLVEQGYQADDIADLKSGGAWGNPDLCGLSVIKRIDGHDVEVVTVEVKPSLLNWERQFFEAVSHRRFANRSYFAFAHPEEEIGKIPSEMRYYSELFGVGVLVIRLGFSEFDDLQSRKKTKPLGEDCQATSMLTPWRHEF